MNPINKVRYNNGTLEPLSFNKDNISIGISSDYMINDAYAESCFTGWYQSVDSSGSTGIFDNYVVLSNKGPGGSIYLDTNDFIRIDDSNGYLYLNCNDFTLEFWVYVPSNGTFTAPIITNTNSTNTSGYKIEVGASISGIEFLIYLGSSSGTWDIYTNDVSGVYFSYNTWHHVCLSRKNNSIGVSINGSWTYTTTSNLCIDNLSGTSKVTIGGYNNTSPSKNFYITNIRYYIGRSKYNLNSNFTPPSYPISAIGKITNTDSTPLLLNSFQESKILYNSGQRSLTITNSGISWTGSTPFLYDIPEIYRWKQGNTTNFVNNLRNIAVNMGDNVSFTTVSGATDWYLSKNNIFIQNFNYENIPTSGLTYLYDPEHIMSLPGSPFSPTGYTGSSVYNLIDNTKETWEIFSLGNYKGGALVTDLNYFYLNSLDITAEFSVITIFRRSASTFLNSNAVLPGVTANTANGFKFVSNAANRNNLDFKIYNSSSVETTLLSDYTGYTLTNYNMFTITSNGSNSHHVYRNNIEIASGTTTVSRTSGNININWGSIIGGGLEDVQFKLFMVYDKKLTGLQVSDIYDKLRNRIGM